MRATAYAIGKAMAVASSVAASPEYTEFQSARW